MKKKHSNIEAPKKSRKRLKIIMSVLILLIVLLSSLAVALFVIPTSDAKIQTAKLIISQPEVTIIHNNQVETITAKTANIYVGDQIRTGSGAIAYIVFSDNSSVSLDENTQIEIRNIQDTKDQYSNSIDQIFGRTWSRVENLLGQKSQYELRTPNTLAAVRGTQFICENDSDMTTCKGIEHKVSLRLLSNNGAGDEILIDENQQLSHSSKSDNKNQDYKKKILDYKMELKTKWEIYTDCMNKNARNLIASDQNKRLMYVIDHINELGCGDSLKPEVKPTATPETTIPSTTPITTATTKIIRTTIPITTTVVQTTPAPTAPLPSILRVSLQLHYAPIVTAVVVDGLSCVWVGQNGTSYQVSLGTSPGNTSAVNWMGTTGTSQVFLIATYNLNHKTTYYCNVIGLNSTGQQTVVASSNALFLP